MSLLTDVVVAVLLGSVAFFGFAWWTATAPFWAGPRLLREGPAQGDGGFQGVVVDSVPRLRGPVTDVECVAWWLWERGGDDDPPWVAPTRTWADTVDIRLATGKVVRVRLVDGLAVQGGRETFGRLTEGGIAAYPAARYGGRGHPPLEAREDVVALDDFVLLAGSFSKEAADSSDPMRRDTHVESWSVRGFPQGRSAIIHVGPHRDFRLGGPMWRRRHRLPIVVAANTMILYLLVVWAARFS